METIRTVCMALRTKNELRLSGITVVVTVLLSKARQFLFFVFQESRP